MKICLITKKEKPGVSEVVSFLTKRASTINILYQEDHAKFPSNLFNSTCDIFISYISGWIVPMKILERTRLWNINFHPGPPEYPGTGCFNFAIYNSEEDYGTTSHLMKPKVDTGKIIYVNRFKIKKNETVKSLSDKTYLYMLKNFYYVLDNIFKNKRIPQSSEKWKRQPYKRSDLEELAEVKCDMDKKKVSKIIRATYLPGKPAPFIKLNGHKFEYNPDR